MNVFCRIFGHKLIGTIYDGKWDCDTYNIKHLQIPICKRCGLNLVEIKNYESNFKK